MAVPLPAGVKPEDDVKKGAGQGPIVNKSFDHDKLACLLPAIHFRAQYYKTFLSVIY